MEEYELWGPSSAKTVAPWSNNTSSDTIIILLIVLWIVENFQTDNKE